MVKRSGPDMYAGIMTAFDTGGFTPLLTSWSDNLIFFENLVTHVKSSVDQILKKAKKTVLKIVPSNETNIEELKKEVWNDLSYVYYKYEVTGQKRAFREVAHEMAEKIMEGKWDNVYRKLYRTEQSYGNVTIASA
jgi:hypothetical protein